MTLTSLALTWAQFKFFKRSAGDRPVNVMLRDNELREEQGNAAGI